MSIKTGSGQVGAAIAAFISKYTIIDGTYEVSGGADANARLLRDGKVQLAMLNSFTAEHGYKGDVQFAKEGKIPVRVLMWGNTSFRRPVGRVAAGIRTIPDFAGKRILCRRTTGADTEIAFNAVMKAYGVDISTIKILSYAKPKEVADGFKSGTADGAYWPLSPPNAFLLELQETMELSHPSIPKDKWDAVLKELGVAWYMDFVPANTYKKQPKDVWATAIGMGLCTLKGFSDEAAYQIVKAVLGRYDDFKLINRSATFWTPEKSLSLFAVPFHPGAVRYFKEIGAWTSEHEQKQKAVLAR